MMNKGIGESFNNLRYLLQSITCTSVTSLGPAILTAIGIAGECGPESSVIVCTDGLSNYGIGNLEDLKTGRVSQEEIDSFYQSLANYAKEKEVAVNLISIKGEDCDLETLTTLTEVTGGNVDIIDPFVDSECALSKSVTAFAVATNV
mmetsp:Transcript_34260/g.39576  ORF Transcript_34260/g.39576 Transcript_34260/m.39576 type:complete len:147 (+) Transcript_34260:862-1302(+)